MHRRVKMILSVLTMQNENEMNAAQNACDAKKPKSFLRDYQKEAISHMKNGCILNGGVGSGKSRTSLYYYFSQYGGSLENGDFVPMRDDHPKLYIITTARKRDTLEWETEIAPFGLSNDEYVVDSWNNIKKYAKVYGAFFIFDEQRVVGSGTWVKSFLKITRKNKWILLSATPGDTWKDYIPVFIANGFYHSKTEFQDEHVVWSRFTKYPKIDHYVGTGILIKHRNDILVNMDFQRQTVQHHEDIYTAYDTAKYKSITRNRWDIWKDQPIKTASELCYALRRAVNEDESRQTALLKLFEDHPKMIIFYNFDYELEILRSLEYGPKVEIAEWNGWKHQPLPTTKSWVYLVQYSAGCEGWNCITTDTIVFYSQNYSYKVTAQAAGRIDRLNTPYVHLYYYHLKSRSGIDLAISKALDQKKRFNESGYIEKHYSMIFK